MRALLSCTLVVLLLAACPLVHAQGLLVNVTPGQQMALPRPSLHGQQRYAPSPPPQSAYKIKELSVHVKLRDQVAQTQVSQTFVNTGSRPMEVCFVFPLPYDGAVDQMTLLVDGKEFPAKLLGADEARRLYEETVRKNRDPALLEWIGTGMFKTSVFPVPAGAERKITLRYAQLCRKARGLTDFLFPLSTARYTSHPVEKLDIQVAIESGADIKNVYSPTHAVDIKRPDNTHAVVTLAVENQIPGTDFRLVYDTGDGEVGTRVISYRPDADQDGYFLLLASPKIKAPEKQPTAKTVVFVVDRSGSMSGEKIEQAKGALRFVLNNLHEGDLFNIVAYDGEVESFRPKLEKFNDQARKRALGFIEGLFAGGSTNIDAALTAALGQLTDSGRPSYVIFLTDGLPTAGETNEAKIVAAAKANNHVRARMFAFGVGYDVNSRLLDKLARENFGQSEYVRRDEDIEARVSSLYARIGSPVMTDVTVDFSFDKAQDDGVAAVNRMYPAKAYDLFASGQLVVVGRYKKTGAAKVTLRGTIGNANQEFGFPANFVEKSGDETDSFIEKLWATRRVGEIIDELDLKGHNDELVKELVELSTKHGILTPYTSFLSDENTNRHDLAANTAKAREALVELKVAAGESGVAQRANKGYLQRAAQLQVVPAQAPTSGEAPASRFAYYFDAKRDKLVSVSTVQNVGRKTFFRRAGQWIDGSLSDQQQQHPKRIERYSAEYFKLIDTYGKDVAKYLNFDEPVIVQLGGLAYSF